MKTKILSLLLVITLLAITVSTGLPAIFAADDNLFTNGDFSNYSGSTPDNWGVNLMTDGGATATIVKDTELPNGNKVNALKVTTANTKSSTNQITHKNKIKIERNATYTMTYWVKVSKIKGLKTIMFEPDYISLNGETKHNDHAAEGQNIYTYSYNNGSTRVCRTDIEHSWTVAETGAKLDNSNVSMFISRSNNVNQVLTPDYPSSDRQGEWMQIIHTFATGMDAAHEAYATYEVTFPCEAGGEVWVADFKMNVVKPEVDDYYTPTNNNETLGYVSKNVGLINGKPAEITAIPFGENIFDGWFVDGELVSTDKTYTFTYDINNPPKYEARFTKGSFGIDGSFESGYTKGQLLAQAITSVNPGEAGSDWTNTTFLSTEKNNSGFVIDSHYGGTWRKATISDAFAHTGKYSVLFGGQYGAIGYKFTNLAPNTDYKVSVYGYMTYTTSKDWAGVEAAAVTPANASAIAQKDGGGYTFSAKNALAHTQSKAAFDVINGWGEISLQFNTQSNTEVIFWIESLGTNANLYLDNYSISRPPQPFRPSVNDVNLGTVSSETTNVFVGADVTVTAESVNDGQFKGWYIGDELKSTELTYSFTYAEEFKDLTAKFEKGVNSLPDYSFENTYVNDQLLAQSSTVNYDNDTSLWSEEMFKESSKDGNNMFFIDSDWSNWGKATATTAESHTGQFSIKMSVNARFVGYKLKGLQKNTKYTVSFYAMTKGTTGSTTDTVGTISVTDANMSSMAKDAATGKLYQRTVEAGALGKVTGGNANNTWKKFSVRFDSKDSTDVIVWIRPEGAGTQLYFDDMTLEYTPKEFKPASNNSGLGAVTPTNYIECVAGQSVTVTASPYPNVDFLGWYVGDELISEDKNFTFNYEDKYQGLTAVFAGTPGTIPNGGLEYYQNGQVLASYNANNDPAFNNNAPWHIDTTYRTDTSINVSVTNEISHSGEKAVVNNTPYRLTGLDIEGLKPNTEYIVSFYAYITGSENPTYDTNPKNVTTAFVFPKGKAAVELNSSGKYVSVSTNTAMGVLPAQVNCWNEWQEIAVMFTTTEDVTDVTLWVNFSGQSAKLYMDDFVVYQGVKGSYSADLGGNAYANFNSDYVPLGSEVTVYAEPLEGNTFAGWYDAAGNLICETAEYTFIANDVFKVIAKFDGYNKPATDMFSMNGFDGTFENGDVGGWKFSDTQYSCEWCSAATSNIYVYEGKKSLAVNGRYRNSLLPLTGLTPNSDYRLSFYVCLPDTATKANVDTTAIIGEHDLGLGSAGKVFTQIKTIPGNSGWNRVDLYFNSGADTAATLAFRFSAETLSNGLDKMYLDNMSLYRYDAAKEVVNGDFNDGKFNWIGDGTVTNDGGNKVLSLDANQSVYQDVAVDAFSTYSVSFKAKGNLTLAAQDLSETYLNAKNYITAISYIDADGETWTEYTFKFYSGVHKAINLVLKAGDNGAMVDDVKVVKQLENAGSIIKQIDFEDTDLWSISDNSSFSVYTATSDNDPNVYSGRKALKFTYNELLKDTSITLDEAWLSYQTMTAGSVKVTMKYRIPDGSAAGTINLAPDYSGNYGGDSGFEHFSKNDEWQTVSFYFSNSAHGPLKLKIASVAGSTEGDFYVDDIVVSVTPPMVLEENSKVTYCERLYNAIDNEGFENTATANDWANLPSNIKIVKGDALKGDNFLRATSGAKYILPIKVVPGKEYCFGASIRGTSKTVGKIGLASDAMGNYFVNRDDEDASIVKYSNKDKGWKRSGFRFTTDSEYVYLTIDVSAGALDVDSVMLFTSDYGYRYDPNDYTNYVPYNYDNLKSTSTVINGGYGEQPYYKGSANESGGIIEEIEDNSPATGDSIILPVISIVLAVLASAILMLIRKRKEGAENA